MTWMQKVSLKRLDLKGSRVNPIRFGESKDKSPEDIDRLKESARQSSIFRLADKTHETVDFQRLQTQLRQENHIPDDVSRRVLHHIQTHMDQLGMTQVPPAMILHWLTGLLREQGYNLGELPLQSLELSLGDVEMNIYHPLGSGAGADQNPEATSQRIAQRIKAQFATRRIFQDDVTRAHDEGRLELLHLGAVDRPHDVFLTPDYLKQAGLPITAGAPSTGPAKRADVLLAHLIRFTHELQNHFAGNVQWGYVNTLILPYLEDMSDNELSQFVQQMLFEFAQLDVERGGLSRNVILDFDLDLPRQLRPLPALGPNGEHTGRTYADYATTLDRFNAVALDILRSGDYRGNPFHSPHVVYHLNDPRTLWSNAHQSLAAIAFERGNPSIGFSFYRRDFGPLGLVPLNQPEFLSQIQHPAGLRGFSTSSLVLNLPRLCFDDGRGSFQSKLDELLDLAVSAHRQKRLFISRLMAFGNRGPLQFLRRKIGDIPFLKINQATQPMGIAGLAEAAALMNGSPRTAPRILGRAAADLLQKLQSAIQERNQVHKLNMHLAAAHNEHVAYRFAYLDLRDFGQSYAPYVLRRDDQPHPIYTDGANVLAFESASWRERMAVESSLHAHFDGRHMLTLFHKGGKADDPSQLQKLIQTAIKAKISLLQFAPDLRMCNRCYATFADPSAVGPCPDCGHAMAGPYGLCQVRFSPVHTWCLGKRAEWKIRRRLDDGPQPVQDALPL